MLFGEEIKVQKQQEGKDVRVVVRIQQLQREDNKQQFEDNWQSEYQLENKLDMEIQRIRRLMVKVSQKKTPTRKQSNNNKRKTIAECESIASGEMQHKVWRPTEQQQ